jgi:hypothetical protein
MAVIIRKPSWTFNQIVEMLPSSFSLLFAFNRRFESTQRLLEFVPCTAFKESKRLRRFLFARLDWIITNDFLEFYAPLHPCFWWRVIISNKQILFSMLLEFAFPASMGASIFL